jgi:adenylate cyclase class 2
MSVETEVKLYITDLNTIREKLLSLGAALHKSRVFERNVRYENESHTLIPNDIVLRLRQDEIARLTYKARGPVEDGIMSRYEAEVEVSDFATMDAILGKLGYHPYMVYEKYRTTYHLDGVEIVLDEMPYGNFIEVEGPREIIEQVLEKLRLSAIKRYGYSYAQLFEFVKYHLKLDFDDLTFENFKGITVPESAFQPVEMPYNRSSHEHY